jgi:hypothetical protein
VSLFEDSFVGDREPEEFTKPGQSPQIFRRCQIRDSSVLPMWVIRSKGQWRPCYTYILIRDRYISLKLPYLRASYTKSVGPIKFCIEIYLPRLLFFKTLRRLGAIFETTCIYSYSCSSALRSVRSQHNVQ